MAGLTDQGYEAKRFRDLVEDVQQSLQDNGSNIVISDTSNKVVNNIVNPILLAIAEAYELGEEVWNSFDIDSAEGVALDRLAAFKDTIRRGKEYSTGLIEFTQTTLGNVNTNTIVQDTSGRNLYSLETRQLSSSSVNSLTIDYSTSSILFGINYFLTLGGETFSYTSVVGDTLISVYSALKAQIDSTGRYVCTNDNNTFFVKGIANINFDVSKRDDMLVTQFSTLVKFRADVEGDVIVNANTATLLITSVTGNVSVTNPRNFDRGSLDETDEELRKRLKSLSSVTGKSVPDAIIKGISEVEGVDSITLSINTSIFTNSIGQPPKSYEAVVIGGDDQAVADAILDNGAAGIRSFGNVSLLSQGEYGGFYPVSFTRPDNVYVFLNVEFEKYEEFNTFPNNGIELIRSALVAYSSTYKAGQDVIPSNLNNVIYSNVSGVGEIRITAGYSYDINDTSPVNGYSQNRVSIGPRELALLTADKIVITETQIN